MVRHRAGLADDRALADGQAVGAMIRRPAGGRPDRRDAAEGRGNAQRSADVVAEPERRGARRDQRGLAAAAAAARSLDVPRIVGAPVERIVALGEDQKLRDVALGERNGAGGAQRRHMRIVPALDRGAPRRQPERRRRAGKVEAFLDRDREPGERPGFFPPRDRRIDLRRALARALGKIHGDRVEPAVDGGEPRGEMLHHLARGEFARGNERGDLARGHVAQNVRARCRAVGRRHGRGIAQITTTASTSIRNSGWASAATATNVCAGIFLPKNSSRIGP